MKYQHAEALALAIHSCKPGTQSGAATAAEDRLFNAVVDTVAAFVEAQPTLYGGKRFTEVAHFGKPTTQPANAAPLPSGLPGTITIINNGIPIVDERGNLLGYTLDVNVTAESPATDTDDGTEAVPPSDPKAEAKARRALRRAKRQAEADAALLAAIASNGAGQGNTAQP